jgi:hypothetical protein
MVLREKESSKKIAAVTELALPTKIRSPSVCMCDASVIVILTSSCSSQY